MKKLVFKNFVCLIYFSLLFGCTSTPMISLNQNNTGCVNILPPPTLQAQNIEIGVANTIIKQVSLGKIEAKYRPTFQKLLLDSTLNKWVMEEVHCQISKNFNNKDYQLWFLTMKTVSEKESPENFIKWLENNPPESYKEKNSKIESELSIPKQSQTKKILFQLF